MKYIFEATDIVRGNALKAIANLSEEQLHIVPNGFNNNIIWNLGHMVATQQMLCYRLGNEQYVIPKEFVKKYSIGTNPKEWTEKADLAEIKDYFALTSALFLKDYEAGKFMNFMEYKIALGITVRNRDEAIMANYGHENLHLGVIMNLKKLV